MESNETDISGEALEKNKSQNKYKLIGGVAFLGISGISAIIAGFITSHVAKKKDKELLREFGKEPLPQTFVETPYSLALRALAWGTVWAVGGCSLILFGVWKWYGFKDFDDLKARMRSHVKKSPPTDQRTEFESLTDLLNYLNETYKSGKKTKGS